ncbi:MAG: zinc finger domain-containing protein [Candidatus Rokuibacteriota bacterium]
MSQVVVSTECPSCGGPLDFSEGANAIHCASCGSDLLVTGRKQVLSYWVAPKVRAEVAGAVARTGRLEARVARARLYFVPFYRLTGHDFQWQDVPPAPEPESPTFPGLGESFGGGREADRPEIDIPLGSVLGWGADLLLGRKAGDTVRDLLGAPRKPERRLDLPVLIATRPAAPLATADGQVQFLDRYVEKTFPAADFAALGVPSLGVRAQALRVSLFEREALAALGTIVAVQSTPDGAMTQGLAARGFQHVIYRQVLGRILSVIYFPFWVVELQQDGERWLTVVDGVAETLVQPRAPLSLYEALERPATDEPRTVGLRPLVCPNCGWALPVAPDDVIFSCGSCNRAWQIHGVELTEMPHEIADITPDGPEPGPGADLVYLPFWQLEGAGEQGRAWVPAFRYRRLKALHDLAARLTARPPAYRPWTGERPAGHGCFYDAEDAALLARFAAAGRRRTPREVKAAAEKEPAFAGARLTWIPFKREGRALLDPSTGLALQERLLG